MTRSFVRLAEGEGVNDRQAETPVTCACGARYTRVDRRVTFKDNDAYCCRACGAVLAEWNGYTVAVFRSVRG